MSRNSSGTCSRTKTGGYIAGTDILATDVNSEINDIIIMLTDSLSRSGKGGMSANLAMGGLKVTGAAAGSATGDYVEYDQLNTALALKAAKGANTDITSLASPDIAAATATTQAPGDNTTKVSTTAFVKAAIDVLGNLCLKLAGAQNVTGVKTFNAGAEPVATNLPKAWVSFDGTGTGTLTPASSFNIASVVKNSTGNYTVTFTNALADGSFCVSANVQWSGASGGAGISRSVTRSSTTYRIQTTDTSGSPLDVPFVELVFFR